MAITWPIKITPIDIANYIASVTATRMDSLDPDNPKVYVIHRAKIETVAKQLKVMDRIWAMHQTRLNDDAAVSAFISSREVAGKANLEARE